MAKRKTKTKTKTKTTKSKANGIDELREFALALPGAREDHPWGESVAKVGKKVFVFFGKPDSEGSGFSIKLPESGEDALELPFCEPTGYGLGKSGWVTVHVPPKPTKTFPAPERLCAWIEESYRAVAPKKLVRELDERG